MKIKKYSFIIAICSVLLFTSCSKESSSNSKLIGTWRQDSSGDYYELIFSKGNKVTTREYSSYWDRLKEGTGTYSFSEGKDGKDGVLVFTTSSWSTPMERIVLSLSNELLLLSTMEGQTSGYVFTGTYRKKH